MSTSPENKTSPTAKGPRVIPTHNRWRSIKVGLFVYGIISLVIFLAIIQVAQALDFWSTSGGGGGGAKVAVTGTDPAEIKGWMTIKEVMTAYNLPVEEFYNQFKIPPGTPIETPMKDIEKVVPGFSVDSVRTWLTERRNR